MSALTHPILGLITGLLILSCAKPPQEPSVMRMPVIWSQTFGMMSLNNLDSSVVSSEDRIIFSMSTGSPPHRVDALSIHMKCWSEDDQEAVTAGEFQGPWTESISIHELVPDEVLNSTLQNQNLNCLWDLSLKDDKGHVNFQKDIPVALNLSGGGVSLLIDGSPTWTLHEYILKHYSLKLTTENPSELEIICRDLGSSKPHVASSNLSGLISEYLQASERIISQSDFINCRIISRSHGKREFSPAFTLIRNYEPLTLKLDAKLENSGNLLVSGMISNPNPFPVYVLLQDGSLWKDLKITYSDGLRTSTLNIKEGPTHWRLPQETALTSITVGDNLLSGYKFQIEPMDTLEVSSISSLHHAFRCWTPQVPQILRANLHLNDELPIHRWKDNSPGSPLKPTHPPNIPVELTPPNRFLTRKCN